MDSSAQPKITEKILRDQLVALWMKDLDQRETDGKNRSPMIDKINKRLHVPLGSPYCIGALLVEGVEALCTKSKLRNPVIMTAGTQDFWWSAPEKYHRVKGTKAKKGDIGILVNKGDSAHGHAFGLATDQVDVIHQVTIEYNTSPAGSRDGDGCYQLIRTQDGTPTKTFRGAVDVVKWIIDANHLA